MARSVLLLLAGAVTGGAGVWLLAPSSESVTAAPPLPEPVAPPVAIALDQAGPQGFAAERLAIYEQAAQAVGTGEIESLIELALDDPPSRLRDLRVSALLSRYAEIDLPGAVQSARVRYLDPQLFVPLFERWADSDPDAAIRELALMSPPALRHELALTVLGVLGNDVEDFELVAAALPAADRVSLEVDAMTARIGEDPAGALNAWLGMPNDLYRTMLLPRIAEIAAWSDPAAALTGARAINDYAMRRRFMDAVTLAWANRDPDGAFEWLQTAAVEDLPQTLALYQALAVADSARLLAMLDSLPGTARATAQNAALQGIAEQDPANALAMLASMPAGAERDRLLQTVATTYGRQSPDQALAWARSLPADQSRAALYSVLRGLAVNEPLRAIDLLLIEIENDPGTANPLASFGSIASSPASVIAPILTSLAVSGEDFVPVVERLLNSDSPQVRTMLSTTILSWARQDTDSALNWALRNLDRIDASTLSNVATAVALTNIDSAVAVLDRLPPAQRSQWAGGLVQRLASSEPQRAIDMLERIRGQPGYETTFATAALAMARSDAPRAAELLRSLPESAAAQVQGATTMVVRELAGSNPAAAIDLALAIDNPNARGVAFNNVAAGWAAREPAEAARWVRGLDEGAERDRAIDGYLTATAASGFDTQMLEQYSSDEAREQGAGRAIMEIGETNLPEARRLLDRYVTTDTLRRQIEASLARSGGIGASDSFVMPPLPIRQD